MERAPNRVAAGAAPARPDIARGLIAAVAALGLGAHIVTSLVTPYEFHRDEFLYFAMGEHLSLFRMDFPPAIALLAQLVRSTLGDSLVAIRLVPALFGTGTLVLAALIARELGGGRFAQGLTGLCVLANPLFLRAGVLFQPVVLDQFAWTAGFYALARLVRSDEAKWWVTLGAAAGFGLLAKFTIGVFGAAVTVALFATRGGGWLRQRGPWLALGLALAVGSPSLVGQLALDVPLLSYLGDLRASQLARVTALGFVTGQIQLGPTTLIAAAGIAGLFLDRHLRAFRLLGWAAAATLVLLIVLKAKDYYLGPVYPMAYAAGGVALGRLARPRLAPALRWTAVGVVVAFGVLTLPLGLPILPPPTMAAYAARVGGEAAVRTNVGAVEQLPQDYADMLGWHDLVRAVAGVYAALPTTDQEQAVLLASNYGEAGALDFYGPRYGLPRAVVFVGTYWRYGPGDRSGDVTIAVGFNRESLARRFAVLDSVATVGHPYAVEEQRDQVIYVTRRPYRTFQDVWPELEGRN